MAPTTESRLSPFWESLDRLREGGAVRISALLVLLVASGDYFVGTEVSFSIFYFLPISVAAWYAGRWVAYGTAAVSALCWLANDLWLGHQSYSEPWIPYWNAFMRLMIFLIVVTLLSHWQQALARERIVHEELDLARRAQLELKDQLLSHVSHELRTPLTAAHQFVAIVQDGIAGPVTDRQSEYLDITTRNLTQLSRMIGDLLDASRSETGKLKVEPEAVRIDHLLGEVIPATRAAAADRGIDVTLDAPAHMPTVLADPGRVRQVVTNLVDNALKFTPSGGHVTIRAELDEDRAFARVSVADTGRGIPPEDLDHLFERLYQAGTDDSVSRQGLGLGLFISREIVLRHGGRIWAESEVGRGSSFHFTLPLAKEDRTHET